MTLTQKILWIVNLAFLVVSIIYGSLTIAAEKFRAIYLIHTLFFFGSFIHLTTYIIVRKYTPGRVKIQLRTLFFIIISYLFLTYTLLLAGDPRLFSHITMFLTIYTLGIAGSFLMNNSNVLQKFSYRSIIHFFYWFFITCVAITFLFNIGDPLWISSINWIILLTVVTMFTGILIIPSADKEQ